MTKHITGPSGQAPRSPSARPSSPTVPVRRRAWRDLGLILAVILAAAQATVAGAHRTAHFEVHARNPAVAQQYGQIAEQALQSVLRQWFPNQPNPPWLRTMRLCLYHDRGRYGRAGGFGYASTFRSPECNVPFCRTEPTAIRLLLIPRSDYRSILLHEVTHAVINDALRPHQAPRWVDEGMAILSEQITIKRGWDGKFLEVRRAGQRFSVPSILTATRYPPEQMAFYAHSYVLSKYLYDRGGPEKLVKFVRTSLETDSYTSALRQVYGIQSVGELDAVFANYPADPRTIQPAPQPAKKPSDLAGKPVSPQPAPQAITGPAGKPGRDGKPGQRGPVGPAADLTEINEKFKTLNGAFVDLLFANTDKLKGILGRITTLESPDAEPAPEKRAGIPWVSLLAGAAGAAGIGLPAWAVIAYRGAKVARRIRKARRERPAIAAKPEPPPIEQPSPDDYEPADDPNRYPGVVHHDRTIVVDAPPPTERHRIDTQWQKVESDHYRAAHEKARQEIGRRYPGAIDVLEAEKSLTSQFYAGMTTPA